jgi:hypothetical protein
MRPGSMRPGAAGTTGGSQAAGGELRWPFGGLQPHARPGASLGARLWRRCGRTRACSLVYVGAKKSPTVDICTCTCNSVVQCAAGAVCCEQHICSVSARAIHVHTYTSRRYVVCRVSMFLTDVTFLARQAYWRSARRGQAVQESRRRRRRNRWPSSSTVHATGPQHCRALWTETETSRVRGEPGRRRRT